jgi:hypothetical protein
MSFETRNASRRIIRRCPTRAPTLRFRAPAGDPTRAHVLCLGGTETFGRFVEEPYPNLLPT